MRTVVLDLNQMELFEAGSLLLSHLYYPNFDLEGAARDLHHRAVCHAVLRKRAAQDVDWASKRQWIAPRYAFMDAKDFKRGVRESVRRERDRRVAGKIAVALLAEAMTGNPPLLPRSMNRLSLAQLADFYLDISGESEAPNVLKRAWAQSKPVVHLAAALEIYWRQADELGVPGFHADMHSVPGALAAVVALAKEHQAAVLSLPAMGIHPDQVIEFELVA
jgi:hypothetical protein